MTTSYNTPSRAAFHCRKLFHSCQREHIESNEKWLRRIEEYLNGCEFGTLSDYMLIDKFISGLSDDIVDRFAQTHSITVQELLTIAREEFVECCTDIKMEASEDIDGFLALELTEGNTTVNSY